MGVAADVAGLDPVERVEMFEWDAQIITGKPADILRWHPGTTVTDQPIVWQGKTYNPMPIEATGFERNGAGTLPRPTLRASNIGGMLGAYVRSIGGALGARVTRRRTLGKYLDAVNFPKGNTYADPNTFFPDEIYYVARKAAENPIWLEMELAARWDVANIMLPRRQVVAATCQWVYRSAECSYAGPPVQDIYGKPTTDPTKDACRKTLNACQARFGANGVLRTSAFPASTLARNA
jgi:lambda family phage minor tail protein L